MIVRYDDPHLLRNQSAFASATSPFVIAIKNAGIRILPSILNSIILVTVLSVANASSYGSSRVLSAMADVGMAPRFFNYIDRKGRPLAAFVLSFIFGLLAYLGSIPQQTTVFFWLLALCGLSSVVSWASICLTHIYFRYALQLQETNLRTLPYRSPLGVFGSCVGLVCNSLIILCQFFVGIFPVGYQEMSGRMRAQSLFEASMFLCLLVAFYILYKYFKITEPVVLRDVDFSDTWTNDTWQLAYIHEHPPREEDAYPSWVPEPVQWALEKFAFPW
jgi:yeast amino acid transporter